MTGAGVGLTGAGAGFAGAGATRTGAGVKCGALTCGATLIAEKIKAEIMLLLQVGKGGMANRLATCVQSFGHLHFVTLPRLQRVFNQV